MCHLDVALPLTAKPIVWCEVVTQEWLFRRLTYTLLGRVGLDCIVITIGSSEQHSHTR